MQLEHFFIVYLITFRLAIIAAGVVSIILGYRLFTHGISAADQGSAMSTSVGTMKLELKNAAPGTFFAVFGVVIISVMLVSSPPEFESQQSPSGNSQMSLMQPEKIENATRTLKMRADDNEVTALLDEGINYAKESNSYDAIKKYQQALDVAQEKYRLSELFAELSFMFYVTDQQPEKALHLSQMAVLLNPTENNIDTYVDILVKQNQKVKAQSVLEDAVKKYPGLAAKLGEVREKI
jgi:tetratricopeptide (TPR) repeat protein